MAGTRWPCALLLYAVVGPLVSLAEQQQQQQQQQQDQGLWGTPWNTQQQQQRHSNRPLDWREVNGRQTYSYNKNNHDSVRSLPSANTKDNSDLNRRHDRQGGVNADQLRQTRPRVATADHRQHQQQQRLYRTKAHHVRGNPRTYQDPWAQPSNSYARPEAFTDRSGSGSRNQGGRSWWQGQSRQSKAGSSNAGAHLHPAHRPLPHQERRDKRPNIILLLTDDQDVELGSLNYMPKLMRLMREEGAHFPNAYTSTPMCCPSRSSILTGMYIHNHEVYTNNDNCSSPLWQERHEPRTFAKYLHDAGYRTGYFGKYLNKYNGSHVPSGWREWAGLKMNSRYYNYTVNRNNKLVDYGDKYPQDYYPHVITQDGLHFIRNSAKMDSQPPFLMVLSYPAPHGPEDSAPEHAHKFFNASDHHTVAYNYAPNPDKQWMLQFTPRMTDIQHKFTDLLMTKRLQTLQTIDESVERLIKELSSLGELDNTYIFYTSDHGYHMGQFGLVKGKSMPFEFDIKVPFLVRGPGIKQGSQLDNIALNVDLAPTFLDIAGVKAPPHMDGRSLLPLLKNTGHQHPKPIPWRHSFLVESSGRHREEDALELRDMKRYQRLNNLTNSRTTHGALYTSKHERLEVVCQNKQYQTPCMEYQKWECVHDGVRWRLQKCRPRNKLRQKNCVCERDLGMGYLVKLEPEERRRQRVFLKKYVTKDLRRFEPKFLKVFNDVDSNEVAEETLNRHQRHSKWHQGSKRLKRYRRNTPHTEVFVTADPSSGDEIQAFAIEEEMREIDDAIDELADELEDLESVSSTVAPGSPGNNTSPVETQDLLGVRHGCHASLHDGEFGCVDEVYQNQHSWKTSKAAIDDEIQRLRQQLFLLKDLRKHLHEKRPNDDETNFDEYDLEVQLSPDDFDLLGLGKRNEAIEEHNINQGSIEELNHFEHTKNHSDEQSLKAVEISADSDIFTDSPSVPAVTHITESPMDIHEDGFDESYDDNHSLEDISTTSEAEVTTITSNFDSRNPSEYSTGIEEDILKNEYEHANPNSRRRQKKNKFEGFGIDSKRNPSKIHGIVNGKIGPSKGLGRNKYIYPVAGISKGAPHPIENETTRPICWCNKRMAMKLAMHEEREIKRAERLKLKEERTKRREHKQKKKERKVTLSECNFAKLNCYTHDNDHWRTPPLWRDGSFCFCMNAANNTYWCLRTINDTENIMYCEFITGLVTYYDLNIDPYQLRNVAFTLSNTRLADLHEELERLRTCSGADHCDNLETEQQHNQIDINVEETSTPKVDLEEQFTYINNVEAIPLKGSMSKQERLLEREERRRLRKEEKRRRRKFDLMLGENKDIQEAMGSRMHKIRLPRKSRLDKDGRRNRRRDRRKKPKRRKSMYRNEKTI